MTRSPVRIVVTVGLITVAAAAAAYVVSRAIAAQQQSAVVADDIEAQLAALDPVTRTAVVARLTKDAAAAAKSATSR